MGRGKGIVDNPLRGLDLPKLGMIGELSRTQLAKGGEKFPGRKLRPNKKSGVGKPKRLTVDTRRGTVPNRKKKAELKQTDCPWPEKKAPGTHLSRPGATSVSQGGPQNGNVTVWEKKRDETGRSP